MELISRQSTPRRLNYTDGQAVYDYVVVIFRKFANFTDDLIKSFSLLPFSLTTAPNPHSLLIFSLLGAPFAVPSSPLYSCDIGSVLPLSSLFWRVGIVRCCAVFEVAHFYPTLIRLDVFIAELKRLQEERQAIIDAGGPKPPRSTNPEDDDIASGPPELRKQVSLLNREISQQAEAHAQSLAAVEAVCAEKLPDADAEQQIFFNGDACHASPTPPPPPPPRPDQGTSSPQPEDDPNYV
ncbi:hypothetical protein PIB30_092611 [Stylosanthes scabra]|uniref:Uncharacterized protein n=1 Tax=Stylosanthes scabra TaxID=79078 RepID=A0ABU6QVX2_9FABA|nr:hypothetical protein [Stylosanthes scabra]